jgi:hypothetical protein
VHDSSNDIFSHGKRAGESRRDGIQHVEGMRVTLGYEILHQFVIFEIQELRPYPRPAPLGEARAVKLLDQSRSQFAKMTHVIFPEFLAGQLTKIEGIGEEEAALQKSNPD